MLKSELLRDDRILILSPEGPLAAADFARIAAEVDPFIEASGSLHGLMIDATGFPGWEDFAALVAHLKFVRDHQQKIERVAAVADGAVLAALPRIANHFLHAEVRHFDHADRDAALAWLRSRRG